MKKGSVYCLTKGISLEKSQTLLPWKTCFSELKLLGKPESRCHTGTRLMVWKNEQILNGISVDLNVVINKGAPDDAGSFRHACAYISESDFEKAKLQLETDLGRGGRFVQHNDVEYSYVWKVKGCEVSLSHEEKFGSYWKLEISRQENVMDLLRRVASPIQLRNSLKTILSRRIISLSMEEFQIQAAVIG